MTIVFNASEALKNSKSLKQVLCVSKSKGDKGDKYIDKDQLAYFSHW